MEVDENEMSRPPLQRNDLETEVASSSGTVELPLARVKTIMQKGSDDLPISQEGLFAMAKAAEMFIGELAKNLHRAAETNYLEYSHFAEYVQENDELDFLHDMIPRMVSFKDAVLMAKNAIDSAVGD